MPIVRSGLATVLLSGAVLFGLTSVGAVPRSSSVPQEEGRPRILVTNDDGVRAPGLRVLVKELSAFADVYVSAPAVNRSGSSHAITFLNTTMLVSEFEVEGAVKAIGLGGTPADAAHFGIVHMSEGKPFDLLISGMNSSSNVGDLSHMSGTVGAAMEGVRHRIPSMAVSLGTRDLAPAAAFARRFAQQWLERGTDAGVVYSVNIPAGPASGWKGVRAAPMGGNYLAVREYKEVEQLEDGVNVRGRMLVVREHPEGSDSQLFEEGYVTITPLRFDWTHREAIADLADWDLE